MQKIKMKSLAMFMYLSLTSIINAQVTFSNGNWISLNSNTTNDLRSVHFVSSTKGWAVGLNGTILHTNSSGNTWSFQNPGTNSTRNYFDVHFINENTGWAGGGNVVSRTTNGGANWGGIEFISSNPWRSCLFPVSATVAWGAGWSVSTYRFRDFYRYTMQGDGSVVQQFWSQLSSTYLYDIYFIDQNNGWAVGKSGAIVRISNASSDSPSFNNQTSNTSEDFFSIQMLDANIGWVVGDNGTILKTTNGGNTWSAQTSGTSVFLRGVHFLDSNIGCVVGNEATILKTTNGGNTWTKESSGVTTDLFKVYFITADLGYAVGNSGVILKYGSGGPTNTPPILSPISDQTIKPANTKNVTLSASDADGDQMTLSIPINPGFLSITNVSQVGNNVTATLVIAPSTTQIGTFSATVQVEDGNGGSDMESFTINVTASLNPPRNLSASVTGQTVKLSWELPLSQHLQKTDKKNLNMGQKKFLKAPFPRGYAASKQRQNSVTNFFQRNVNEVEPNNDVNEAQRLTGPSPVIVDGNAEVNDAGNLSIDYGGGVTDDLEDLYILTINSTGLNVTLTGANSDLDLFLLDEAGENIIDASLIIGVADEEIDSTLTAGTYIIAVTIYDDDPGGANTSPYVLTVTGDISGGDTGLQSFNVYRSQTPDAINTGSLVGTVGAGTTNFDDVIKALLLNAINNNSLVPQTFHYQITAVYEAGESDPSNEVSVEVDIQAANDVGATTIQIPDTVTAGQSVNVSVTVQNFGTANQSNFPVSYIYARGTPVTENYTGTLNAGATGTKTFSTQWVPQSAGTYQFNAWTALAGDEDTSNDTLSALKQVIVLSANNAPTLSAIANQNVIAGTTSNVPISASDADGDQMSFSIPVNPGFLSIINITQTGNNASALLVIAPAAGQIGRFNASVQVGDSHSNSDQKSFIITVFEADTSLTPNVWVSQGPQGGTITDIVFDPTNAQIVFASVDIGGIYRSSDYGKNWQLLFSTHQQGIPANQLAIDPANSNILYGAGGGGVSKSMDGGASWQAMNSGLTAGNVSDIEIDPTNPNVIYVATEAGIFKSTSAGAEWIAVNNGLTELDISSLTLCAANPDILYAGSWQAPVVFKTSNSGANWSLVYSGSGDTWTSTVAVDPTNPDIVFANEWDNGGVFRSTNGGSTWDKVFHEGGNEIIIDPVTPATVYLIGNGSQVFKSIGGGIGWSQIMNGITSFSTGNALAINPFDNSIVLFGTGATIFRSENGGLVWNEAASGIVHTAITALAIEPTNSDIIYAGSIGGFFRSTDGARSWQAKNNQLAFDHYILSIAVDPVSTNVLYLGTSGSLWKSTDRGEFWFTSENGIPEGRRKAGTIVIDPGNTNIIYAGFGEQPIGNEILSDSRVLYKSIDSGANWSDASSGIGDFSVMALVMLPTDPNTLYAGTAHGGIFKTTDAAATWSESNNGLFNKNVCALAIDAKNANVLYAGICGNNNGIFKSTDGGASWTAVSIGNTRALLVSRANGDIFAGTYGSGVFRSEDAGGNWVPFNDGLKALDVNTLVADLGNPNLLYAGTGSGGIYKVLISPKTDVEGQSAIQPTVFVLQQNYPNPFNPTTLIQYSIAESENNSFVKLEIYNLQGKLIRTLVSEKQNAGAYQIEWDAKDNSERHVPSGLYLYRIRVNSFVQSRKMLLLK